MPQTKPIVSIVNVVSSASIDQKMDLIKIEKKFPETEYNPEQFPGLVFRLTNPKTATLIFSFIPSSQSRASDEPYVGPTMTLYVGNLPYRVHEGEVKD
mgnify:CR=1 FL=1